jgi:methionyl-tRNA synthetase
VLCANAPETKDNDFTWRDFQARNNNELVATLGNFVNRAAVLTHKFFEGKVPALGELTAIDQDAFAQLAEFPAKIGELIENYRFRDALAEVLNLARLGNKYLAETQPWHLIKTDVARTGTVLHVALQIAAALAPVLEPFLPESAQKLATMLNLELGNWASAGRADALPAGHQLREAALLFAKIEDATVEAQVQKLLDTKKENQLASTPVTPAKADVSFDEFGQMDLRIGTILAAEKVAKTKKLLKLTIDLGLEQRTIVSGIAEHFIPEALIGQQVQVLLNLAPREIKGIQSQGMLLMAENADGTLALMQPSQPVRNGSGVV